jgi:NADPH-dependent ferric siderophore reductase
VTIVATAEPIRPESPVNAFAAGESKLATGARRHLVNDRRVPKANITFCGYWRAH